MSHIQTQFHNPDHLQKLLEALKSERNREKKEHEQQIKLSLEERIAIGLSWPLVHVRSIRDLFRRGYMVVVEQASKSILHDGISEGDMVLVHPTKTYQGALCGRCVWIEDECAEIRISSGSKDGELPHWLQHGTFVITRDIDEGTYDNYEKALHFAENNDFIIKKALLSHWEPLEDVHHLEHPQLNQNQQLAVGEALDDLLNHRESHPVSVIHGPPGTGKTHTLSILISICIQHGERPWALADSNAAADNMVRALRKLGIDVLRLGSEYRMAPDVFEVSLQGRIEHHPQKEALIILEKEISKSIGKAKGLLYKERRELIRNMERGILEFDGQVIVSTLGTMSRRAKDLQPTKRIIVDEATQAIEPAIWSVIPFAKRLVLMGDPHQLGPVVEHPYLQRSLLQRLIDQSSQKPIMLNIQHRMQPLIMDMVRNVYGRSYQTSSLLIDHPPQLFSESYDGFWKSKQRVFLDTAGYGDPEERDPISYSLFNPTELEIVERIVKDLQKHGLESQQIAIITPYRAQVAKLQNRIPYIEVTTINAFQGRERDVIICSFVRSNFEGQLGFVQDERRLTVALTRAKQLCICIGDTSTLAISPRFSELFDRLGEDIFSMWSELPF